MPQKQMIKRMLNDMEESLPTMPRGNMRILDTINNSDSSMDDIHNVVSMDVAISSQIMCMANSAMFAGRMKISSLKMAIQRLGRKNLKLIVFTSSMQAVFIKSKLFKEFIQELWQTALKNAFFCRFLGTDTMENEEELFLLGLIHNVGKIFILSKIEQACKKRITQENFSRDFLEEIFEGQHIEVGKKLLRKWAFPTTIIECHNLQNSTDFVNVSPEVGKSVLVFQLSRGLIDGTIEWEALNSFKESINAHEEAQAFLKNKVEEFISQMF